MSGRAGFLKTTAGVSGPRVVANSKGLNGDEEGKLPTLDNTGPALLGLSYEDPRMRAISSSARPRFRLGCS